MIPLLISLATVAAYLMIGFTWSRRMLPKWWAVARFEWRSESIQRSSVKDQFFWKAIVWPWFMLTDLDALIDSGDPMKLKCEAEEREQRIRELERELGIK